MSTRSRRIAWLLVVALAVGGGAVGLGYGRTREKPKTRYETVPAERGRITARVTATGTLSALVTVQVGSQVSGRIKELHADFNSTVKKGQVIARIDPQIFMAAVERERANRLAADGSLAKAKAQAADAERQRDRLRGLKGQNLVAQAELDTAESNALVTAAQVTAAEGAVAQVRAALNQAQINVDYTTISSPIDGVVISRSVDVGQTVAASLQAPTLFTIAEDLRKMQVDTNVAEADVGRLRAGMAASFLVDAYPGKRWKGTVRQIRNAPQTLQNVVTYDAVIDVENPELELKPGMTANVTFVHAEKEDALRIPNAALRFKPPAEPGAGKGGGGKPGASGATGPTGPAGADHKPPGDGPRPGGPRDDKGDKPPDRRNVWILRDDKPVQVSIKLGVSDGSVTEVVEGDIKAGDAVIIEAIAEAKPAGGPPAGGPGMRRGF